MQRKLLGIISVDFDTSGQLRIIYSAFVKKNVEKWEYNEAVKGKGKGSPYNRQLRPRRSVEVQLYPFMTSALRWGGWSAPRPGRFTVGKDPVPIVQEAG